jgi:peroxiredoxin
MKNITSLILFLIFIPGINAQLSIGDQAPEFNLKNINSEFVSLLQYANEKGVIVIFTCNHCPFAKLYEDRIVELDKMFKPKGFPVVAINPNNPEVYVEDSFDNMIKRAREKGFTFPYLVDNVGIYKKYGATKTPHVFILQNRKGQFTVKYIGAIDDNAKNPNNVGEKYVRDAVVSLLEMKEIRIKETRAIGCSIKPY